MSVKITLDSKGLTKDDTFSFETYIGSVELKDLLVLKKICDDELSERIKYIDKRNC